MLSLVEDKKCFIYSEIGLVPDHGRIYAISYFSLYEYQQKVHHSISLIKLFIYLFIYFIYYLFIYYLFVY